MKSLTFFLLLLAMIFSPLLGEENVPSRFLFQVDKESLEELADRFSTTPDTILGTRTILFNGAFSWEYPLNRELTKGELLSFPDQPPYQVVDLGEKISLKQASEKLSLPEEELRKLNTFSLAKNLNELSRYVIPKYESIWILQKKKYEWGLQSLGSFFVPLYTSTLFFLGFGIVIVLRKFLNSKNHVTQNEVSEIKDVPYVVIEVLSGNYKGKRVKIEETVFTIGRDPIHNHALTLEGENKVSGKHARIHLKPDGWVINDMESKGGTLLNKRDISKDTKISHGMIIELGFGGVQIRLEPFTPEIAKAYGAKSTTEIKKIAKEANAGEISKRTRIFSIALLIICLALTGFGYKTQILENRISLVEEKILHHEKKMADMKTEIQAMNTRVSSLESSRKETVFQLQNLFEKIKEVSRKTEQNSREILSLQQTVERLPSKLQKFHTRSAEFSGAVNDLNNSVLQKKSEEEVQKKSDLVKEKLEALKQVAGELQIDVEDVEKQATRIDIEPEKEKESGVRIVDLLRGVKKSMRGANPILKASFAILHSLVDNQIVLTLAPILKETGVMGIFGFLI